MEKAGSLSNTLINFLIPNLNLVVKSEPSRLTFFLGQF
jgi:hypothetical protein